MQASELLHDLLGYDDEHDCEYDDNYDDCQHRQQYQKEEGEGDRWIEGDGDSDGWGGGGEGDEGGGDLVKEEFQNIMRVQEQQHNVNNIKHWKYVVSENVNENECSICLMEEKLKGLPCGHRFCKDCLSFHVKTQTRSRHIQHIRCYPRKTPDGILEIHVETLFGVACPHIGCNYVIQDLASFLNRQDLNFFDDKCLDIVILKMRLLGEIKPCPHGCGYIVQENCMCVNEDCRKRQMWFMKLDAKQKQAVLEKEKLAMRMAFPHSKKCCPKCYVEISKNGGCDHMHCVMCDTHFSWSTAPEYGLSFSWYKEQTAKLFKESKITRRSLHYYILSTGSPFKKRKYFAQLEKSKRSNEE